MMVWILLLSVVNGASHRRVAPDGRDGIGVAMGEKWVPRGSWVQVDEGGCEEGVPVRVTRVNPWYRASDVELVGVGDTGCLPSTILAQPEDSEGSERAEKDVQNAFFQRFGPIDASKVVSTPWGFVALPMQHELTVAEREREFTKENLRTGKQRERATDAYGPSRDGVPVYTHFLGSDAPRSDRWGTPAFIVKLLAVFDEWAVHCRDVLPPSVPAARAETCTVQVGDLAWYSDVPYRLGHTTHFKGNCADIRLFRDDGSRYEARWNRADDRPESSGGYSRDLTQAFLEFVTTRFEPTVVYFNDPEIGKSIAGVREVKGHDDHIHLCF